MNALLVRVGADQSPFGGNWNGPVDSRTREFIYVPIPDDGPFRPGLETPYASISSSLGGRWPSLPPNLASINMHLDPDFGHLTYGDQGKRAEQIRSKLQPGDLLVFYAGLADVIPAERLVYALIGLLVVDEIVDAATVPSSRHNENAHTRRRTSFQNNDIVVRAKAGVSGRLKYCIPIGSYRRPIDRPEKRPCYRVASELLSAWGGLSNTDGFLQRSARLPQFLDAERFYDWFRSQNPVLLASNH